MQRVVFLATISFLSIALADEPSRVTQTLDIAPVWAGHPVGFALWTQPPHQFVAFYDADRALTVAQRLLTETHWRFFKLPEQLGWDSHNSIEMALDPDGCIHLAANMHCVPLKYYRTAQPFDASTFETIPGMVGRDETKCTYPVFFTGPDNQFMFEYRTGQSGNGDQIFNVYDRGARTWHRLLETPFTNGEGLRNAYLHGPVAGPDGYFHFCWIWRESPDCATNHTVCYARGKDMRAWESAAGAPLTLPITLAGCDVVSPVPEGGGAINGNVVLGFDLDNRPVVSYHAFDGAGNTQLYNARFDGGAWRIHQSTQWEYRWTFGGGGAIEAKIRISPVQVEDGALTQHWSHPLYGSQTWRLDPNTLSQTERIEHPQKKRPGFGPVESEFPGMEVRTCSDSGGSGEPDAAYWLRWETLPPNRDKPREQPWPKPSMLRLIQVR